MSALCLSYGAQPRAWNLERKGEKLRNKVQHNDPPTSSSSAQHRSTITGLSTVGVREAARVRACSPEGIAAQGGSELSASDITRRAVTERAAAQPNIQRCSATCMCATMRVSETEEQNAARVPLSCVRNRKI